MKAFVVWAGIASVIQVVVITIGLLLAPFAVFSILPLALDAFSPAWWVARRGTNLFARNLRGL